MSWFSHNKRSFSIVLLLCLALALFAYIRKEIFLRQAKRLIKQTLEKNLPCKLSVGRLRAGLFYGPVLEELEISFSQLSGFDLDIKVAQAFIKYNLWRNIFSPEKDILQLRLVYPDIKLSYSAGAIQSQDSNIAKFIPHDIALFMERGELSLGKAQPLLKNLRGKLLLNQKGLYLQDIRATFNRNPKDVLKVYGQLSEDKFFLTANFDHLKIGNFDILTNLTLTLDKKFDFQGKSARISGTLKTYGSVLNSQPFPELNSSFDIQGEKLRILTFKLGDSYDLRGIVNLSPPLYDADLSLNFYQAAPNELVSRFSFLGEDFPLSEQPDFSGLVNGLIKITGELRRPKIEGYLEAKEGHISDLTFVSADINIKGRYPKIMIVDSRICREEDSFMVEGEIDFTNLEQRDFLDIRLKSDKGMLWQGWDITRQQKNQVHMSKSVADDVKITFDTFIDDEGVGGDNYTSELGLEYKIFGDKLLRLRLRKEEEIVGVERRIKF